MMKLQVSLKTAEKGSAPSTFEVVVNGSDSVKSVKDKVPELLEEISGPLS